MPEQEQIQKYKEYSFQSLWDDYERRTWTYQYVKTSLGKSNPRLLHWIGSVDYSGYTREECLTELISNTQSGDENRILLRLQDWVPEVQKLAQKWVCDHFRFLPLVSIKANQRLILYLSRKDRLKEDVGMREIKRDLVARVQEITFAQFFEFDAMFRRFLFMISLKHDQFLRKWILKDPDPFNRLLLLSQVGFSEITLQERRLLQADKSVFVRRRWFQAQIDLGNIPTKEVILSFALDSNRSLRQRGQFYMKHFYGEDAYVIYRTQKSEAFYFIADYARVEDVEHFLVGIGEGGRLTQQACMKALIKVAPDCLKELDIPRLICQNREFRILLFPILHTLLSLKEILSLRSVLEQISPSGTASFLRILERKSFWVFVDEGLSYLIENPETSLLQEIQKAVHNRVAIYEPLSSELRQTISEKIMKLRNTGEKETLLSLRH